MGLLFDTILLDTATLLVIAASLMYYYFTRNNDFWKKNNVPYIEPKFFFGNFKEIVTGKTSQPVVFDNAYKYFKSFGRGYGGLFQLQKPAIMVYDLELIKEILIKTFPSFHSRGFAYDENFDPMSAQLILLSGPKWKFLRTRITPTFTSGKLKLMIPLISECGEGLAKNIENLCSSGQSAEFDEIFAQFTTDVIGSCIFGLKFNALQDPDCEFRKIGRRVFSPSSFLKIKQNIANVFPQLYRIFKLRNFDEESSNFFIKLFQDNMELRERENIQRNDFMDILKQVRDTKVTNISNMENTGQKELDDIKNYKTEIRESDMKLNDEILAAQAFGFFVAGFETSSSTASCLLLELSKWPHIQDKIAQEIEEVFEKHGGITYDALLDLKYMEQVMDEGMRMYTTVPCLFRECNERFKLPGSECYIEPGMEVYVPTWSLNHDPDYWTDPETFNPDRFSEENREKIPPYLFMPFGAGPRICLGMRFAYLQMKVGLINILRHYRVVACEKTKPYTIDPRTFVLRTSEGIWLKLQRR